MARLSTIGKNYTKNPFCHFNSMHGLKNTPGNHDADHSAHTSELAGKSIHQSRHPNRPEDPMINHQDTVFFSKLRLISHRNPIINRATTLFQKIFNPNTKKYIQVTRL